MAGDSGGRGKVREDPIESQSLAGGVAEPEYAFSQSAPSSKTVLIL